MISMTKRLKLIIRIAKQDKKRFEQGLKKLEHDDLTSNHGEFPVGTLLTDDDLAESNRQTIDELDRLKPSMPTSMKSYIADISHSLLVISQSLRHIENYLIDNNRND